MPPVASLKVPAAHAVQALLPAAEKVPTAQAVQLDEPAPLTAGAAEKEPAAQASHEDDRTALWNKPAAHAVQLAAAASTNGMGGVGGAKLPAAQTLHPVAPPGMLG